MNVNDTPNTGRNCSAFTCTVLHGTDVPCDLVAQRFFKWYMHTFAIVIQSIQNEWAQTTPHQTTREQHRNAEYVSWSEMALSGLKLHQTATKVAQA